MSVLTDPSVRQSVARCGVNLTPQMEQKILVEQLLYATMHLRFTSPTVEEFEWWNKACAAMAEKIKGCAEPAATCTDAVSMGVK